jgi:hypothetical protein
VCFGGFSKATEGNPLLQCYYPAQFHGGIEGVTNYSAGEVETGGKWIDGRKIYRRVVEMNVTAKNAMTDVYTFPENVEVINMGGYVNRSGGTYRFGLNWYAASNNYHIVWMETATRLVAMSTTAFTGYAILEYVKSAG